MTGRARGGPRDPTSVPPRRSLADVLRDAFEAVSLRGSARVLLVHGGDTEGKSLFVRTIEEHFAARLAPVAPAPDNLWHVRAGGDPIDHEKVREARVTTQLRRVAPEAGWLSRERVFAQEDKTEGARVFLFDDVHEDVFIREWADLTGLDYARLGTEGHRRGALGSVAQRLVEDCRGDFRRSIFVLVSNDVDLLNDLKVELDRSWVGLAHRVELAPPEPERREEIT